MDEIRKDKPEDVMNQTVNGKKRVVTKEFPEKLKKKMEEKMKLKQKRLKEFVGYSFNIAQAQAKQQEILKTLASVEESVKDTMKRAFKKLRLANEKDYNWRFDGRNSFIGVYNIPKPKPEAKK